MFHVGIIDGKPGAFGVRIPDCPGAYGMGKTVEAAVANTTAGLDEWAEEMIGEGREMPEARTLDAVSADPNDGPGEGEGLVLVPFLRELGRPTRVTISIDVGTLKAIDAEAARRGLTRSGFLASAARDKIREAATAPPRRRRA